MYKLPPRELIEFLEKWGALGTYIVIGLIGKFGYDIVTKRKMSFLYVFGTGCMGIFVGWITSRMCVAHSTLNPSIVVPVATLVSRDILLFLTMVDYVGVLKLLTGKNTKEKK